MFFKKHQDKTPRAVIESTHFYDEQDSRIDAAKIGLLERLDEDKKEKMCRKKYFDDYLLDQ